MIGKQFYSFIKSEVMYYRKTALLFLIAGSISLSGYFYSNPSGKKSKKIIGKCCTKTKCNKKKRAKLIKTNQPVAKACVFKTLFKEESSEGYLNYKTPENVKSSIDNGLEWIVKAQQSNGGWGAGLGSMQHVRDPHAVKADPATTSMTGMALLRCGSTLSGGKHSAALIKATKFLLNEIEETKNYTYITKNRGTQIQNKLGQNIDAVITAQFLSNLLSRTDEKHQIIPSLREALDICVKKIQNTQDARGRTSGGSWAGVLQSSMANAALEAAEVNGAVVDSVQLEKARDYQVSNYDSKTGTTNTSDGAGIMLYSMSGSVRSSAKRARKVREEVAGAIKSGKIEKDAEISPSTLQKIGYSEDEALKYNTSYKVYESAKKKAQTTKVMNGFGNNGGEEFISFLQTGESLVVNNDDSWNKWYDNVSAKMLVIQNANGSWNGHHCITSPAFCTASCLLILSINNDAKILKTMGSEKVKK